MSHDPTKKDSGWLLPKDRKQNNVFGLYLVSTPIGNLGDITLRALDVLAEVDLILCEDTRVTRRLLSHYDIHTPIKIYNDHSGEATRNMFLSKITGENKRIALVSDAGTPLVSDPGYKLVREALDQGIYVTSLPGANAPLTALQLSGFPSDSFSFIGFLSPKSAGRRKMLTAWKETRGSLIAFETAPRLKAALADIAEIFPSRQVAVVRELTKRFEEGVRGVATELLKYYEQNSAPKGEIVLVIAPAGSDEGVSDDDLKALLLEALQTHKTKDAVALVAEKTTLSKNILYEMALALRKES